MQVVLVKARLHDFVYVFDWNLLKENCQIYPVYANKIWSKLLSQVTFRR